MPRFCPQKLIEEIECHSNRNICFVGLIHGVYQRSVVFYSLIPKHPINHRTHRSIYSTRCIFQNPNPTRLNRIREGSGHSSPNFKQGRELNGSRSRRQFGRRNEAAARRRESWARVGNFRKCDRRSEERKGKLEGNWTVKVVVLKDKTWRPL